jgi:hypothetical protein
MICVRIHDDHEMRACRRRARLAQPAERQHSTRGDFPWTRDQDVEVSRQLQVLKPIIHDMNRGAETTFGEQAAKVAILADAHDRGLQRTCQHERLVAGTIEIGQQANAIRHDDDAIDATPAFVSSAEDCRPLSLRDQPLGDRRDQRRLASAADAQVADADHRLA